MMAAFFMGLARYKLAAEVLALVALAVGAIYGVHQFLEHERDIGRQEVRAEYAKQLAEAKDAARQRETELTAQRDKAIENANTRDETIRTLAARAGVPINGLRDTIAAIGNSVSSATADALRATARTYGDVLTECSARRGELAVEAEKLNSEKRTLIEAWPQNAPSKQP
jgi:hypothetical protein